MLRLYVCHLSLERNMHQTCLKTIALCAQRFEPGALSSNATLLFRMFHILQKTPTGVSSTSRKSEAQWSSPALEPQGTGLVWAAWDESFGLTAVWFRCLLTENKVHAFNKTLLDICTDTFLTCQYDIRTSALSRHYMLTCILNVSCGNQARIPMYVVNHLVYDKVRAVPSLAEYPPSELHSCAYGSGDGFRSMYIDNVICQITLTSRSQVNSKNKKA
ncbi:hypothetical protein F4860DRAFT_367270 [Xylaria cubensis]|nr:hypothetical protein F4860DRAFT_367270 [Xylaria cubensis]